MEDGLILTGLRKGEINERKRIRAKLLMKYFLNIFSIFKAICM